MPMCCIREPRQTIQLITTALLQLSQLFEVKCEMPAKNKIQINLPCLLLLTVIIRCITIVILRHGQARRLQGAMTHFGRFFLEWDQSLPEADPTKDVQPTTYSHLHIELDFWNAHIS